MLIIEQMSDTVIREVVLNGLVKTPSLASHEKGIILSTDFPWRKEERSREDGGSFIDVVAKFPLDTLQMSIGIWYPLDGQRQEAALIDFPDEYPLDLFPEMAFTLSALRQADLNLFDLLAGHLLPQTKLSIDFVAPNEIRFEIAIGTFRSVVAHPYDAYLAEETNENTVWNLSELFTPVA